MRKLVYVLVGLFALFALIKAYSSVRAEGDTMHHSVSPITSQQVPSGPTVPSVLPSAVH